MEIKFDTKKALVTGAGKGIGRGVALKLAECGAEVLAVSRTKSDLDELAKEHPKIKTLVLDIGEWEKTKTAIEEVGPIDLLVNNAAIVEPKLLGDITEEDINRVYDVNLKAVINITQVVAKGMITRGQGGSIVNVSSIAGLRASPLISIYGSGKGAMDQLTRCMAVEYGPHKIRVNSVNPTVIRTRLTEHIFDENAGDITGWKSRTPLGRFGEVVDVVDPVLFLLSDKADLITGVSLPIDGGLTISF